MLLLLLLFLLLLTDRLIIQGKWVYKVKGDPDQPTFKARYDYTETFSPNTRMEIVRALM